MSKKKNIGKRKINRKKRKKRLLAKNDKEERSDTYFTGVPRKESQSNGTNKHIFKTIIEGNVA